MRRWAKLVEVNGAVGVVYHSFDSDHGQFAIHVLLQTDVGEANTAIRRKHPWTQAEFDAIDAEKLVAEAIGGVRSLGFEAISTDSEEELQ